MTHTSTVGKSVARPTANPPDTQADYTASAEWEERYTAAAAEWQQADRDCHVAMVRVMFGEDGATDDLAAAAAQLSRIEADAIIARQVAGRRWFDGLRYCTDDEELKRAVELYLKEVCRNVIEPLRTEVAELKSQLADVQEILAAEGEA